MRWIVWALQRAFDAAQNHQAVCLRACNDKEIVGVDCDVVHARLRVADDHALNGVGSVARLHAVATPDLGAVVIAA